MRFPIHPFSVVLAACLFILHSCSQNLPNEQLKEHYSKVYANALNDSDYSTATNSLQHLWVLDHNLAWTLDSLFYHYDRMKNYSACAQIATKIVRAHENDLRFYRISANAHQACKNYDQAIELYERLIQLSDKQADSYYKLGTCWFEKQEYTKAITCMTEVLADSTSLKTTIEVKGQRVPFYAAALNVIGISEAKSGNLKDAVTAFDQALLVQPDFIAAQTNRRNLQYVKAK
jgi:tetratricopeptide (TPR) repeat protein